MLYLHGRDALEIHKGSAFIQPHAILSSQPPPPPPPPLVTLLTLPTILPKLSRPTSPSLYLPLVELHESLHANY